MERYRATLFSALPFFSASMSKLLDSKTPN